MGSLPPPLEPVIAVTEADVITSLKGNKANWVHKAKQPGFAILCAFLMSSEFFSIKPYVNFFEYFHP